MVGRLPSFWDGKILGAMLNFLGVGVFFKHIQKSTPFPLPESLTQSWLNRWFVLTYDGVGEPRSGDERNGTLLVMS